MPRQLTFDLPVRTALGRDDFFVAPANAAAVEALDGNWPMHRLLLSGPEGSGKTHLASIWASEQGATVIGAADITGELEGLLDPAVALAVEDVDRIAGQSSGEEALFHLLNARVTGPARLLLTARHEPAQAGFRLPDLLSRLQGTPAAQLNPPDDALLAAVFVKLFADRQLAPDPRLITYLVARTERSFAGAQALVARLDQAALAQGRKLTSDLARRVLDKDGPAGAL